MGLVGCLVEVPPSPITFLHYSSFTTPPLSLRHTYLHHASFHLVSPRSCYLFQPPSALMMPFHCFLPLLSSFISPHLLSSQVYTSCFSSFLSRSSHLLNSLYVSDSFLHFLSIFLYFSSFISLLRLPYVYTACFLPFSFDIMHTSFF